MNDPITPLAMTGAAQVISDAGLPQPSLPLIASLSHNDIALLRQIAAGRTNIQIGASTCRSEKTIRNQLTALYAKLGAGNRAEAVAIYMRMGGT